MSCWLLAIAVTVGGDTAQPSSNTENVTAQLVTNPAVATHAPRPTVEPEDSRQREFYDPGDISVVNASLRRCDARLDEAVVERQQHRGPATPTRGLHARSMISNN